MTISERIDALAPEEALEAVNLLAGTLLGSASDSSVLESTAQAAGGRAASDVQQSLDTASVGELAELSRLVLHQWADESPEDVEQALASTGEKAFILEAALIGSLALGAYQLYLSRGRERASQRTTTKIAPDGTVEIVTETETRYFSVGASLSGLLRSILGQGGGD
ncbi:MAG: hypothetical protein AAGC49_15490 [Brevundimonas sp.]|nr:hypothetical protein [Pseudomonadota bacterium]